MEISRVRLSFLLMLAFWDSIKEELGLLMFACGVSERKKRNKPQFRVKAQALLKSQAFIMDPAAPFPPGLPVSQALRLDAVSGQLR